MPEALKSLRQWVLFQLLEVPDANGELKLTKIPLNPHTFHHGSATDPATWGTYAQCVARLPRALHQWDRTPPDRYHDKPATYRGAGIGFVFTAADPFTLVDLDKSLDFATGRMAAWAQDIVTTMQSYTQRSVRGTGLHILVQATIPQGGHKQHDNVQMWDQGRFCAMTGWHLPETPPMIEARQSQLTVVHTAYIEKPRTAAAAAKAKAQGTTHPRTTSGLNSAQTIPDTRARIEEALGYIPADDRTTWYTMGMALHASGEPWARAVWETWSQHSEKYDAQDQERVWKSFKADGGVTIGTLFHEAEAYGYLPPTLAMHRNRHTHQHQDGRSSSAYQRRTAASIARYKRQLYADPYFGAPERRAKGIPAAVLMYQETPHD